MTDELSGLIKESKEPEEKLLDPGQIQTVILAPTFIRYEENYEVLKAIDGKPFLKKLNTLLAKTTVVRQIGLVIIWLTFLNQEESWCKEGHRVGSFKAVKFFPPSKPKKLKKILGRSQMLNRR